MVYRMESKSSRSQGRGPVSITLLLVSLCLGLVLAAGCGPKQAPAEAELAGQDTETSPEAKTAAALRSGSVSLKGLLETLEETQTSITELKSGGATAAFLEGLTEIEGLMGSAADASAEYSGAPPTAEEVKAEFGKFDDLRLKAITELNDALIDLRGARATAESMAENEPRLTSLSDLLALAVSDLEEAIKAFGGTPEEEPAEDETAPPAE